MGRGLSQDLAAEEDVSQQISAPRAEGTAVQRGRPGAAQGSGAVVSLATSGLSARFSHRISCDSAGPGQGPSAVTRPDVPQCWSAGTPLLSSPSPAARTCTHVSRCGSSPAPEASCEESVQPKPGATPGATPTSGFWEPGCHLVRQSKQPPDRATQGTRTPANSPAELMAPVRPDRSHVSEAVWRFQPPLLPSGAVESRRAPRGTRRIVKNSKRLFFVLSR